jgi:hypothetical protein
MEESVMHFQQQVHRRTARCIAVPRDDGSQKFLMIGAYLIASAIIALWLAYLPTLASSIRDSFNIVPQHLTGNSVNRLHKGDKMARSVSASFDARWSGIATVRKPANLPKRTELAAADARDNSREAFRPRGQI